jgi:hypothetical protein
MCRAGDFNLSYESLTSFKAREKLRNMKTTDPEFWAELTAGVHQTIRDDEVVDEDDVEVAATRFDDDSDLPCDAIIAHVVHSQEVLGVQVQNGRLASMAAVEAIDYEGEKPDWANEAGTSTEQRSGREAGKQKVKANTLYPKDHFWHH